jgi:predicted acetyltransferase
MAGSATPRQPCRADYVLRRSRPGALCTGDPTRVRQVEREEFGDLAPAIYAAARRQRAGQIDRDTRWWNRVLGRDSYAPSEELPHNWFVHELPDLDGPERRDQAELTAGLPAEQAVRALVTLASASDTAYRNLWSYLSGIDGIDEVRLSHRPVDEPVRWLLGDARALVMTQQVDFLWLRLLDVPAALAARRSAIPGEVVLEVIDADANGFASGRYRLSANGDEVECRRTSQDPDVEVTQQAMASMYLGGFRLRQLLHAGVATERTPGALDRVDLMFSVPTAPWNATWF